MLWSRSAPSQPAWSSEPIEPARTLYEFDGPLTFTAKIGFFDALLHSVGRRGQKHFFLAAETSNDIVSALETGRLSVRGALTADKYWIIETDASLNVSRYWSILSDYLPNKLLPPSHLSLYAYLPPSPDYIEQSSAYFSIGFKGERLGRRTMPFGLLRILISGAYDATRRILSPADLVGSKSSSYDFPVRQPEFGSLVLALDAPVITHTALTRRSLSESDIKTQFNAKREAFFEEMQELVSDASGGQIQDSLAEERFSLLDNVQNIIPSEDSSLSEVTFAGLSGNSFRAITVDERTGVRLSQAFKRAEGRVITEEGRVEIVNSRTKNFVYISTRGKPVRCDLPADDFDALIRSGRLVNKARVRVRGKLVRRKFRDQLIAESRPEILGDSLFNFLD